MPFVYSEIMYEPAIIDTDRPQKMAKRLNYWLVKSEPFKYSWDTLVKDGAAVWDGVRNYTARNNLKTMKKGDLVFFYHSNEGLAIVGIAEVSKEAFQDPTTDDPRWVAVELKPHKPFPQPVTLESLKADPGLGKMQVVKLSRLSVSAVTPAEFQKVLKMGGVKI